jgi:hypothetical protein
MGPAVKLSQGRYFDHPSRSLVGYLRRYGVDGKEYCGKCFVLETEQEDLGDSSSAVVKMKTDENNFLGWLDC